MFGPVNRKYCMAVDCQAYQTIHKPERYDKDIASEVLNMGQRAAVEKVYLTFNGRKSM